MLTEIITGNFHVSIDGEINQDATIKDGNKDRIVGEVVDECGITWIVQRDPLGAVYKELLEKGQKRNELEYSDATAEKFRASLEKGLAPYGNFVVTLTEHIPTAEASPMVRATALIDTMLANADLEKAYRLAFGAQGLANANSADRDALIEFAHANGLGIQPPRAKKAA